MELILAALIAAVVGAAVAVAVQRRGRSTGSSEPSDGSRRPTPAGREVPSGAEASGAEASGAAAADGDGQPLAGTSQPGLQATERSGPGGASTDSSRRAGGDGPAVRAGGDGASAPPDRSRPATTAMPGRVPATPDGSGRAPRSDAPAATAVGEVTAEAVAAPSAAPEPVTANAPAALRVVPDAPVRQIEEARRIAMEAELKERRAEIARIEERLLSKEETLNVRLAEAERRQRSLDDRSRNLDNTALQLKATKQLQLRELERVAALTTNQARQILLRELQDELRHESGRLVRQTAEEAKRDADRRVRSILATCMQRIAGGHATETTVSVVNLQSDDLKGRIIGREGRNIRSLETLTGIDFIIDDTPSAVILSGFDGVRREIARLTLEKLLQDGRIHPARIEEAYEQARTEIDARIAQVGEEAVFEAKVGSVHPELVKLLGRLHYRTSYGQNVLAHSLECAHLAAMIADELGASAKTARRAALLHDVGKAVTHEIEGPHALVGGQLARRYQESEAVAHAMEAHHGEVEMRTVEAVIVQVADALSGARPGARGESLEQYVKRLRDLEQIATRHEGVEKVYAMQAGREIRVVVRPEDVDDDAAALISHKIARDLEHELEYPGQIKVTVIRESRSVDYAK